MARESQFERLLEPFHIGKVLTRNRMLKTGAGTSFIEKTGEVGETMKGFYGALARGGVGLITVESTGVDFPLGVHHGETHLHLEDDKYIPGYAELTKVIHQHDCPVFIQMFHSGPWHPMKWMGLQPVAASSLSRSEMPFSNLDEPRELAIAEIQEVIGKFGNAAERVQQAGFDGIEINASSAHLINSFLSRVWNKREDIYGYQTLESRSRFLVEIVREVKNRLGQDFPISVLLNGIELGIDSGTTVEEARGFARILQNAGVDAIHVRAFGYGDYGFIHPGPEQILYPEAPKYLPAELDWTREGAGAFVPLAEAMKQAVKIPVITVGRLDPELGEEILRQGKADFIGLHRRLLADPEMPNKVAAGQTGDIAPCMACLYCWHRRRQNQPVQCRINAALGREQEYAIRPAEEKKKVLVAGGGPAGMEAARVAALRGHEVMLYERDGWLGGLLNMAVIIKESAIEDPAATIRYFKSQLTGHNVKIRLGKSLKPRVIRKLKPDVVILAAGGTPLTPEIPGIKRHNVVKSSSLHRQLRFWMWPFSPRTLQRLSRFMMPVGEYVTIIGGAVQGCQLAGFLIKRGRKVTIIESTGALGEGIFPEETRARLLDWLAKKGATMLAGTEVKEITDQGLTVIRDNGKEQSIQADTVLTTLPLIPNTKLLKILEGTNYRIYSIGDCREPRLTADAIADGARLAREI